MLVACKKWAAALVVACAGCAFPSLPDFSSKPAETKPPAKTNVSGWVEAGNLELAVSDERPIAPPPKKYDKGPLGIPSIIPITPEWVVDKYVELDEKYKITDMLLPDTLAASVKKLLPKPQSPLPVGVETKPHPATVRIAGSDRTLEVSTDAQGHARVSLAPIAIATLEQGEESTRVSLDAAEGAHGELALGRNDLLAIADRASLPDYGLDDTAPATAFWSVVAARARTALLAKEAEARTDLRVDSESAHLLVAGQGRAELPDGARVDWSPRPRPGVLLAAPRVEVSLDRSMPGALVFFVRVVNEGEGGLWQLRARTRSSVGNADGLVLLFGRVAPGEAVERRFKVDAPAVRDRPVRLELDFGSADGQAPRHVNAVFSGR